MSKMRWRDVTREHDGKRASVSAASTPKRPIGGDGPYVGRISCTGEIPMLRVGAEVRSFAWWYDVEILGD